MRTMHLVYAVALGLFAARMNAAALELVQKIELEGTQGRIDHMAADLQAGRLYVAALGNNSVEVIDIKAGKRIDTLKGMKEPQGICVIPDSGKVVVASGQDGKVRVYDRSLKLLGTVDHVDDADNVRYDARTKLVYVGYGDGALAVIDAEKVRKLADIRLDGHPESFQLEAESDRIFVNVPSAHQIAIVDRERRVVAARWPVKEAEANFPMALDAAGHRLFIGCRKPARMLVLDSQSGKVVANLGCCGDTDDLFFDSARKRIYVTGGQGCVSVFQQADADHYTPVGGILTAPGARTALFVPSWGRLFVAVPLRGQQQAELRVLEPGPSGK